MQLKCRDYISYLHSSHPTLNQVAKLHSVSVPDSEPVEELFLSQLPSIGCFSATKLQTNSSVSKFLSNFFSLKCLKTYKYSIFTIADRCFSDLSIILRMGFDPDDKLVAFWIWGLPGSIRDSKIRQTYGCRCSRHC